MLHSGSTIRIKVGPGTCTWFCSKLAMSTVTEIRIFNSQISKFGGDPKKVTIWGQSAGAGSVLQHIVANGGQTNPPLFRAAITSSAFLPSQYKYNDRIPEVNSRANSKPG